MATTTTVVTTTTVDNAPTLDYLKYTEVLDAERLAVAWQCLHEAGLVVEQAPGQGANELAFFLQPYEHTDVVLALSALEDATIVNAFMSKPLRVVAPVDRQAGPHTRPNGSKSVRVPKLPKETVGPGITAPQPKGDDSRVISAVAPNPKKPSSSAHGRYALYHVGMTIAEFIKNGGTAADVKWDLGKGFISLCTPQEWAAKQTPQEGQTEAA
jgi:hypothetical protein